MIQSACCLFIVKHLWVVQIRSLFLLSLMLRLISSRCKFHVLILFVHEIVVKCLRHTGWKVLLMFFIFQIIRGWGWSERGNIATVVFNITIHEVTPSATCPTVCSSRLFKFLIKWRCNHRRLVVIRLFILFRLLQCCLLRCVFRWLIRFLLMSWYIDTPTLQIFTAYLFARRNLGHRGCVNYMRAICRVVMWCTTADNWGIINISVRMNFLLGGRGRFVEIGLFPKICAMCLWHQRILFKLRRSISNLDWLSVMSIR